MKKNFICNSAHTSQCALTDKYSTRNIFYRKETVKKEKNKFDLFNSFVADNENLTGKRIYDRARLDELRNVFDISEIIVKIKNCDICHSGWLHNISSGGAAVRVSPFTARNLDFYLTFFLGTRLISTQATVRHVYKIGGMHIIGFMFVNITNDCEEYLRGSIYITKLLHERSMI